MPHSQEREGRSEPIPPKMLSHETAETPLEMALVEPLSRFNEAHSNSKNLEAQIKNAREIIRQTMNARTLELANNLIEVAQNEINGLQPTLDEEATIVRNKGGAEYLPEEYRKAKRTIQ